MNKKAITFLCSVILSNSCLATDFLSMRVEQAVNPVLADNSPDSISEEVTEEKVPQKTINNTQKVNKQNPISPDQAISTENNNEDTENNKATLSDSSDIKKTPSSKEQEAKKANIELDSIVKKRKKKKEAVIDTINFINPSVNLSKEQKEKVDLVLSQAEQEQLLILWRATLERNKTIRFIVNKLAPTSNQKKKNKILSQVLNTAIFLPLYAIQTVAPADTSSLASYLGAGVASDLINGKMRKNTDKLILTQTELVIMFMMIDQVAERVRTQYHIYKTEKTDYMLALQELQEVREESAASLDAGTPESQFLSQVRIRQLEREIRRIKFRLRSSRVVLIDLSGVEAVDSVDKMIEKEVRAVASLPGF